MVSGMQAVKDSGFPPGTIVIAAADLPRYYEFSMSLEYLQVPEGTIIRLCRGCDRTMNLNQGIQLMKGDWVWLMDDDHAFRPDILMKLLAHAYKPNRHTIDVVMLINLTKIIPFHPVIWHGPWHASIIMLFYRWKEVSAPGLFALPKGDITGHVAMLVKKDVLEEIGYPWLKSTAIGG
jgi:glycosyltransferase involved in cell wall biosynthesis